MENGVRYCTTADGVRIAYCVEGEGVPVLVCPGFVESFSLDHLDPGQSEFMEGLGNGRCLIRFDMRGTGLSQRGEVDLSPGALTLDLDAVVRATRARQCYVWASTLSGPRGIQFAVDQPRRVLGLMLYGTYARANDVMPADAIRGMADFVRTNHEYALRAMVGNEPTATEAALRQVDAYRRSADAEMVAELFVAGCETDVTHVLSRVRCPTLVLHRTGDTVVPAAVGQALASRLARATFIPLQGDAHAYTFGDPTPILDAVAKFLASVPAQAARTLTRAGRPAVRTVLFTDIVGHTEMMQRLGDARGRDVLREHERITRETLKQHGGAEVKTMGDGFMASFGSVTSAMECAIALQRAFLSHTESMPEPLHVRVGLNAGEPIEEDGDLFGATVILASRIAANAAAGEILVPDTVRGLLSGKGFMFSDRGEFVPKGFDEGVRNLGRAVAGR
jgi:class 3 adenylate cyclase